MNEHLLREIPKVDELLRAPALEQALEQMPRGAVLDAARAALGDLRRGILEGRVEKMPGEAELCLEVAARAKEALLPSLRGVVNATGVVLHTNLGRACLAARAAQAASDVAQSYSTLEYDVESGGRGRRGAHVEALLQKLTGAERALVVNNNAAAVLLILSALAAGGEVVVSRGELVEIGGSFRVPEIMESCGAALREVGTTNKTRLSDYERAIGANTRALMKVHTSNYRIVGFTEAVPLEALAALGAKHTLPVIEDLGSGALYDLDRCGLPGEPTVKESVCAGADIVCFSGDKLLGGPQAGIILGRRVYIEKLSSHPLMRAMRVDKMTLAALEATLRCYAEDKAAVEVPTIAMLSQTPQALFARAQALCAMIQNAGGEACVVEASDQIGGGAMPMKELPSYAVAVAPGESGADALAAKLRKRARPVIVCIDHARLLLHVRTIDEKDDLYIVAALAEAMK